MSNYYSAGIKECPFCGVAGKLEMIHEVMGKHYIKCRVCGACRDQIFAENDEQAIALWNARNGEDISRIIKEQKFIFDKE